MCTGGSVTCCRRAVVYDVPQIEDHARIARGVLRAAGELGGPVAPSVREPIQPIADQAT